jgi:hypothetical protein
MTKLPRKLSVFCSRTRARAIYTVAAGLLTVSAPAWAQTPPAEPLGLPKGPPAGTPPAEAIGPPKTAGSPAPAIVSGPPAAPCVTELPTTQLSCFEVAYESICGPADGPWAPLCCFSDGWREPWVKPPGRGPGGAPRQGWLNSFDGHFTREYHIGYFLSNGVGNGQDEHVGLFQFQTPLSRRVWVGVDVPFVVALTGGQGTNQTDFGDISITPRVMLHETEGQSISAGLGFRIPTENRSTGGDQTSLFPHIQFWQDAGDGWTVRGGFGVEVPMNNRDADPDGILVSNLAIGRTITEHDATPFGDFAYYVSFNMRNTIADGNTSTFVSATPGIRTHLGNNLFFLAGVEVPLTGPKPFDQRFLLLFVKGF